MTLRSRTDPLPGARPLDFGRRHVGTAHPGRPALVTDPHIRTSYRGSYGVTDRVPGCACVDQEGTRYFYHVTPDEAGAFRRWAADAFRDVKGGKTVRGKLRGQYPFYVFG